MTFSKFINAAQAQIVECDSAKQIYQTVHATFGQYIFNMKDCAAELAQKGDSAAVEAFEMFDSVSHGLSEVADIFGWENAELSEVNWVNAAALEYLQETDDVDGDMFVKLLFMVDQFVNNILIAGMNQMETDFSAIVNAYTEMLSDTKVAYQTLHLV